MTSQSRGHQDQIGMAEPTGDYRHAMYTRSDWRTATVDVVELSSTMCGAFAKTARISCSPFTPEPTGPYTVVNDN